MKVNIKQLGGGECSVEVETNTFISEIKNEVSKKLGISVEEQRLLLFGKALADDQTVQSYPSLKDGTKLNLVVKKPEGLYEASLKYFKKLGMSDAEAMSSANKLLKIVQEKFNKLSWDDVERLALDCLLDECGQNRPAMETEAECEDTFGL